MQNARSTLFGNALLAALAVLSLGTPAQADNRSSDADFWWLDDPIEGLWDVTVNITLPPIPPATTCQPGPTLQSFKSMAMFARGGTFHDLNDSGKIGPFPRSPGLGTWERLGWRHYRFDVKFFVSDLSGAPAGWTIIRHNVVLARDGRAYVSQGTAENFDVNGVPLPPGTMPRPPVGCSNSTAVRFE
jgi:hypothetical protein